MAIVAPFRGITYNFRELGEDPSKIVAPPYDVISEQEQEECYRRHPYNVIRLILGKRKVGDSDWDNRYTRAADAFERWKSEDVLIQSDEPSMYLVCTTFDPGDGDGPRQRWGLIALVRIEDKDSGVIIPHERTFSAHREDRLKLLRACNAQFSQIFGLFEDPEDTVLSLTRDYAGVPPDISFDFWDGTTHKMWTLKDPFPFREVGDLMLSKSILIADGHHRYETALNFRNMMRARYGTRPPNRSYEYVMMYLANMDGPGLTILPSHRLITRCAGFQLSDFLEEVDQWFEIKPMLLERRGSANEYKHIQVLLDQEGRTSSALGFYCSDDSKFYLLTLRHGAREEMGDDLHPSLKKLDVLVLSRLILQKTLGFNKEDLDDEEIFHYQSDMKKALSLVESGAYQMAFVLNPTKISHVKDVTSNFLIMPRKSTFFYPKVLTGLVFNSIDPHEIIQIPS
ncbi:MAG: DUF1015 domain-containing protein [Deltaproteobacteria bacterium]|nr:DUF1015 domain-containing protein [Deltaproteobacteria bacterium]MBW1919269.1 DUF1015 domain-containing protein [Deltaproteobacteria bacterium]MBW1935090.1 DUF1015 domain-containing protein [Deltaproteobacteria bacterium]